MSSSREKTPKTNIRRASSATRQNAPQQSISPFARKNILFSNENEKEKSSLPKRSNEEDDIRFFEVGRKRDTIDEKDL